MEKSTKTNKRSTFIIAIVAAAVLLCVTVVGDILSLGVYDAVFTRWLGATAATRMGDELGADTQYVKSDFDSAAELYAYEEKLCATVAQDGATLLKNNGLLPLSSGVQLDLYSVSSVDPVSGGSGSGSGSFELTVDLKTGLEHAGFKVNTALWDFYETGAGSKANGYGRGVGVVNYGRGHDWKLGECPVSVIQSDAAVMNSIKRDSVAMFVISRTGGEGGDEPRDMADFGGARGEHYLELDATEKSVISFMGEHYDNVIVLLNSNNAFEVGFLLGDDYDYVDAAVNFFGAGRTGFYGLGYMLRGIDADGNEISPSGRLIDTLVYDNFSSPAMQNFGDALFTDADGRVIMFYGDEVMYSNGQYGNAEGEINEDAGRCPFYFVTYNEGIYIGYKYYETRYEDSVTARANVGEYSYADTVAYPFGFGASYTTFEWSDFSATAADGDGNITLSVKVTNTGDRAGRDVVQLYYRSPYTDYDIANHVEKSAVALAGFKKTGLLAAKGGHETVTLKLNVNDMKSYDDSGDGRYLLEAGDYYITVAPDAHTAVNNILKEMCKTDDEALDRIVETADVTGMPCMSSSADLVAVHTVTDDTAIGNIHNRFDDASIIERSAYLSRNNWSRMDGGGLRYATTQADVECREVNPWGNKHVAACTEINGKQYRAVIPTGLLERLCSTDAKRPDDKKASNLAPTLGVNHDIDLIDMRGVPFDDPKWDTFMEQVTAEELAELVAYAGHHTIGMQSVGKPETVDVDGPAGLNVAGVHGSIDIGDGFKAMTWPTASMLASTFDAELAEKVGKCIGEDGLYGGAHGWYGPGINLHRAPFGGRNFEYYSEDAYISGVMGRAQVKGAATKGVYGYIKHFALNEQETHRDQNGLITFSNEQAMRELYFKPFEMTIVDNTVSVNYNAHVVDADGNITGYEMKTAEVPACTAVMSAFDRLGATWAGGHYELITGVLREEFGFDGMVLTDYDTGNYMNLKQMLVAGADAKLFIYYAAWDGALGGDDVGENLNYAVAAAKNILFTVANSAAMNGYVHGIWYLPGFAYYKIIVIVWNVIAAAGIVVLVLFVIKKKNRS